MFSMLREYTVMEIALIDDVDNHSISAFASLKEYIEVIQDKFKPEHHSFALWCLFSVSTINFQVFVMIEYFIP